MKPHQMEHDIDLSIDKNYRHEYIFIRSGQG